MEMGFDKNFRWNETIILPQGCGKTTAVTSITIRDELHRHPAPVPCPECGAPAGAACASWCTSKT